MSHNAPTDEFDEWIGCMGAAHFTIRVPHKATASASGPSHPTSPISALYDTKGGKPISDTDRTLPCSDDSSATLDVDQHGEAEGHRRRSRLSSLRGKFHHPHHPPEPTVDPNDWGFPGYLSASEAEILGAFRSEVNARPISFREAIFSFGDGEPEDYALCRWLRARKFVLQDAIRMVEEAAAERVDPSRHGFYPDAKDALGVEEAVYKTQYPQVFTGGHSKDGRPLFFSMPGVVTIHGIQAVTTADGVNRYQWHAMHHTFGARLRERRAADPTFERYQSVVVMDLEHLSRSTVNGKVLEIIQHQSRVDALCFPEILGTCVIVNAPTFFSAIWAVIRRWLDPRTAGKIEIFSFKSSAEKRLKELIDLEHLPANYGGDAPSIAETVVKQGAMDGTSVSRRLTRLMHVKVHSSFPVELEKGEEMEVVVFTRSVGGAVFRVTRSDGRSTDVVSEATVHCPTNQAGEHDPPYSASVVRGVRGPGKFKIHGGAHKSRFSSADHFLVVVNISNASSKGPSRLPSDLRHYVYEAF